MIFKLNFKLLSLCFLSVFFLQLHADPYVIPPGSTVIEYDFTKMKEASYQCRKEECADWFTYLKGMDKLRRERVQGFYDLKKVETVFYPASGTDAALGWALFPYARQLIMLDNHAFVPADLFKKGAQLPLYLPKGMSWRHSGHIDGENIAAYMIAGLKGAFPDIRIRAVKAFKLMGSQKIHGLIEFDSGLTKDIRQLLFLSDNIPWIDSGNSFSNRRWYKWLNSTPINAILLKSAADAFLPEGVRGGFGPGHPVLREQMKKWLKQTHGLMIEGRSQYGDSFEFTPSTDRHYGMLSKRCDLFLWSSKFGTGTFKTVYGYGSEILMTKY